MTPLRLGVLINPTAGIGRAKQAGEQVLAALSQGGYGVVNLSAPTLAVARQRAQEELRSGLDALIVVGGDGMAHLGANLVAGTGVPLGMVAAGTGNDVARALGLPTRDIPAALRVLHGQLGGAGRPIDAGRIVRPDGTSEWFLGVLSAGFDAAVNARANAMRWPRGEGRYVRAVLRELLPYRPYGYRITIDGTPATTAGVLVAVANGTRFGGGMRIAPDARMDDGLFDVVIAGPATRLQLARIFPLVFSGRHTSHRLVRVQRGHVVELEPADCGRVPPLAFADGECMGPLPLRCEVVPQALPVLAPTP